MHINQNCSKLLKKKKQGREEGDTNKETTTRRKIARFFLSVYVLLEYQ